MIGRQTVTCEDKEATRNGWIEIVLYKERIFFREEAWQNSMEREADEHRVLKTSQS
jgi:hypothetical protein